MRQLLEGTDRVVEVFEQHDEADSRADRDQGHQHQEDRVVWSNRLGWHRGTLDDLDRLILGLRQHVELVDLLAKVRPSPRRCARVPRSRVMN